MTKSRIYFASAIIAFGLLPVSAALAGKVEVNNENKKTLEVMIKADGSMTEDLASYTQKIPGELNSTFNVDSDNLKGKVFYSITGNTNAFTSGDTCKGLSVEKNYKVTFKNDTVGTTCVAEEMN